MQEGFYDKMENKQTKEISLKDFVDILIPKIWIIILTAVVFLAGAFVFSFTKEDKYTSSVEFFVGFDATSNINPTYENSIIQTVLMRYESRFTSEDFCEKAIKDLNLNMTKEQLRKIYKVQTNPESQTYSFSVTHADKQISYKIAEYVFEAIQAQEQQDVANSTVKPDFIVINAPKLAEGRDSKNTVRNSLLGFVTGAILAAVVIIIVVFSDKTIRDKKKIEDNFDIPFLGIIPSQDVLNVIPKSEPKE